jgi:hypothetical protein
MRHLIRGFNRTKGSAVMACRTTTSNRPSEPTIATVLEAVREGRLEPSEAEALIALHFAGEIVTQSGNEAG